MIVSVVKVKGVILIESIGDHLVYITSVIAIYSSSLRRGLPIEDDGETTYFSWRWQEPDTLMDDK